MIAMTGNKINTNTPWSALGMDGSPAFSARQHAGVERWANTGACVVDCLITPARCRNEGVSWSVTSDRDDAPSGAQPHNIQRNSTLWQALPVHLHGDCWLATPGEQ